MVADEPVYLIVEVPGVKIPLITNGVPEPERVIVLLEASKVPAEILRTLATFKSSAIEIVPEDVKLLSV